MADDMDGGIVVDCDFDGFGFAVSILLPKKCFRFYFKKDGDGDGGCEDRGRFIFRVIGGPKKKCFFLLSAEASKFKFDFNFSFFAWFVDHFSSRFSHASANARAGGVVAGNG